MTTVSMMPRPILYIVRGLPGVGKSTLASIMSTTHGGVWRETDVWFVDEETLEYKFDPAKLAEAHAWCQQDVREWLEAGADPVIVSNTFLQEWEMAPYLDMAAKFNYAVIVIDMRRTTLTDEELAERSVHGLGAEKIATMRRKFSHGNMG